MKVFIGSINYIVNKIMKEYRKRSSTEYTKHRVFEQQSQSRIQRSQSSMLDHEILRIQVCEKQDKIRNVFKKNQKQLCDFFIKDFKPMSHSRINLNRVLHERTDQIRLIKNLNKIYFGGVDKHHKKTGDGVLIDEKGKIYEGSFYDNIKQGHGVQIYPNGNVYIGNFDNNKKHGKGLFYWFTLSPPIKESAKFVEFFSGDWWGGLPDGKGSHQKNTGDIYDGNFKNGLKHGDGEQYFYNGDSYKGQYVNGLPEGFGFYIWKDGSKYEGDFKQGLRNGHGVWYSGDEAQQYKGQYVLDKKCGYGEYIWRNKNYLYKGHFENDLRHGYGELFHEGQLQYKGHWVNGKAEEKQEQAIDLKSSKSSFKHHMSYVKTPKSQKLPSLSRLRPPASAIIKRMGTNANQNHSNNSKNSKNSRKSLVRSKSPPTFKFNNRSKSPQSNNSEGFHKISKTFTLHKQKKLKNPIEFRSAEKTLKKRSTSGNLKRNVPPILQRPSIQKPHYELLVKKCVKKGCGCNLTIPLHARSAAKKNKRKELTHFKTQNFAY